MYKLKIKRIYEQPQKLDGYRILVDRLWPRGVSKDDAHLDLWLKDVAPSSDLRKWFNHEPEKFNQFSEKYTQELKHNDTVFQIIDKLKNNNVTLLYAAKDPKINHAIVLQNFICNNKNFYV